MITTFELKELVKDRILSTNPALLADIEEVRPSAVHEIVIATVLAMGMTIGADDTVGDPRPAPAAAPQNGARWSGSGRRRPGRR